MIKNLISLLFIIITVHNKANNNKIAVTNTLHTNKDNLCKLIPLVLIFKTVVIKLIAPNNEDTPVKCKLKIAKSTDPPECAWIPDNGGYIVHPVPAPFSTNALSNNKINEGGNNQKLILFNLGNLLTIWLLSQTFIAQFYNYKSQWNWTKEVVSYLDGLCLHP